MLGFLQRIGKSLMLPIATLPAAALLLRFGQPDLLDIKFLADSGNAIFANLPIIFAIGIAIGFAKDNNGAAALAGAIGYLVLNNGAVALDKDINLGVLGGIIAGIIAGLLYNRFHNIKLPDWLAFFGGRRFVPIVTSGAMIVLAFIFGFVWPYVQDAINAAGQWIFDAGALGAAVYGLLNRLLIPLGLHHVINTLIWFEFGNYHGVHGEITRFLTTDDPNAGLFLAGFFPVIMFGLPAACIAMIAAAKPERRKAVTGMLIGIALTAFLTGVTEPIEFSFMFLSPVLYLVHALLMASSMAVTYLLGIRDGFGFSAGAIDYLLNFRIATKPLLLLVVGLVYAVIYFIVFYFLIKWLNLKTPGREDEEDIEEENPEMAGVNAEDKFEVMAAHFLLDLGGKENLTNIDNCATRLRLNVNDSSSVDEGALKRHGARGVMKINKKNVQVIVGTNVEFVADALKRLVHSSVNPVNIVKDEHENHQADLESEAGIDDGSKVASPVKGKIMPITDVSDQVFSQKMMGDGFAVDPEDGMVVSPIDGTVKTVFPTKHAIGLESDTGLEVLIHVGLDTVNLQGEGFDVYAKEGEEVKQGQKLLTFDLQTIKGKVPSVVTPVVFTNLKDGQEVAVRKTGLVGLGEKNIIEIK
ncbi:PTS system N-acetylglucosamine-specific IIA component (Glc family) /PTS system N-acetylglucosamine-specific IIB component (Glc family) /PTS system N-acetylglucosamine-specific IIC component (Glc family) [Scopulibacillus darangshiensis]|uniref:PTS system N-acetylglucosamine-specific IIA component (Glc family) /PTS system N-acetylglucosamine-specific IIB component (Glc family) /PTS system N-acetylglucosamine-specific IIC component (Glc fa... n=1 Tax=Scopulibacillus darangshiensis TaxID=442528 RepID=A0A4R2P5R5_9BACL|nr:N-acetylglucosamine-specific PTS transporter subunit IIBC [Scopulibacillus darangshiensis]TCP30200.1 PTS system N-acetylglucosamine-specific IIA component (Glc family) /PTS system N-acetylglucosamine-specific IIB component (Glc family) /PTS system N-acetylglucosamine-specific IIC component (Glc family) [Scopulibacillus darangshiensis]